MTEEYRGGVTARYDVLSSLVRQYGLLGRQEGMKNFLVERIATKNFLVERIATKELLAERMA